MTLAIGVVFLLTACDSPTSPAAPAPPPVAQEIPTEEAPVDEAALDEEQADEAPTAEEPADEPTDEPAAEQPQYTPDTHDLALEVVVEGFTQPLYVDHANDGSERIFVVEKTGAIHIVQDGTRLDTPFLDIADRVRSSGFEQGLLGLAFAPNYEETGYLFVNYTNANGDIVVSRFQVDADNPDQADPDSEFLVLEMAQPAANHNGGGLKIGPDGYLWIGTGDGGGAGDRFEQGQDPTTLLGAMLRIDVTSDPESPYLIPADNPWIDAEWEGQEVLDEIWAIGLRNPWRYSFDRATGDLWIADVGQSAIEAIHFTEAGHPGGLNYGWPILEGSHCYRAPNDCDTSGLELPILEYAHGQGDCSITGGYVYRGEQHPALQGGYIFGDYCSGNIWVGVPQVDGTWIAHHALSTNMQISSFGEDEQGEVYVTGLDNGIVYRITLE